MRQLRPPQRRLFPARGLGLTTLLLVWLARLAGHPTAGGQEAKPDAEPQPPLGQFITVTSPIDEQVYGRVSNVALSLQNQAEQEGRKAILVLQIGPGSSRFYDVYELAKFLSSAQTARIKTVAWIPETLTGHNVVLALACQEIVMHPDAQLGDIGKGAPLDADEQQAVLNLVQKRHNPKVSPALARGMMDRQAKLYRVQVQVGAPGQEGRETRIVTPDELEALQQGGTVIEKTTVIKDPGALGVFSGTQARNLDMLAMHAADSRAEVADLYHLPPEALRENFADRADLKVRRIRIEGVIDVLLQTFVERQIDRAVQSGANLLIFEIDSPGGDALASTELAFKIADLEQRKVRTVAWVPEMALSGAAMISLGCDEIYMKPDAQLGDAAPINIGKGQQFEHVPEKVLSVIRSTMHTLAEKKGRPTALAEAMADKDLVAYRVTNKDNGRVWYMTEAEIQASNGEWVQGPAVREADKDHLLTVNGRRAHELKLAEPPVQDFDQLKERLGIPPGFNVAAVGRTWMDTLVFVLNNDFVTFLLLVFAIGCVYLELHFMTGLLGIMAAVAFALFFWSRFLGGTAGWLEVILFLLGLGCLGLEIFVIPGFGVFGISGGLLLLASLVMASQTFGSLDPNQDLGKLAHTMGTVILSIVAVVILAMFISRYLPHVPIFNQMILAPPGAVDPRHPGEPRLRLDAESQAGSMAGLIGRHGEAMSMLRPAGKAQIDGRFLDVVSEGPFIPQGTPVQVVSVSGSRIVVRQV